MEELFGTLLTGLLFGSGYALLALGIVLIYKGSRVFNFAQAEFAQVAACTVYLLQSQIPYPLAMLAGVVAAVAMGLTVERFVVQPLFDAPKVTLLVATVAVALASINIQLWLFGGGTVEFLRSLVEGTVGVVSGVPVFWNQLFTVGALAVLAAGLWVFFTRTDLGLAVLAASQEPTATNLVGISVRRISALVWAMSALLGGVAGLLLAPGAFTPGLMTGRFLIFAFVAAVVGGMTSLPGAAVGGIVLGLVQALAQTYLPKIAWVAENLASVGEIVVFMLLVTVLALRPAGLLGKEA